MELPDLSHIEITQLPHSLQSLIECIGIENAYRLTCAYGGRPKYIPKHRERTRLADVLPAEALEALIKRFAGVALEIPKADHFLRQLRNQQIQKESADGLSRSLLANKYGLSLRQIGNIRRLESHAR
ncbi:transcriptional regulator [Pseudomonas guariconensis]|uniref:Mor transcription activator family protein n=1 Tax=Pseudomonas TaxID=286 RepID=UPI001CE4AC1F|nr:MULTISPECIES: Mor transcription activator family protein [Pseudomonas]MCO7638587.1 transcriptional regulator [Pseudomonas sp. S 311-6]MCO7513846.1 transcriptional regulator [Pseudomonas putida]MCO7565889.1 transcriptional regulator [Pseudomonas mosselii]MCO7595546.1 transcriptional regulator [Pseudomonas guariconensis]MCO7605351.1 transcriptional regulator [Pseudomonas guariconensis]